MNNEKSILSPNHIQTADREAFNSERSKFRADNLQRVREKLSPHMEEISDRNGNKRVIRTNLRVMDYRTQSRPTKVMTYLGKDYEYDDPIPFEVPSIDTKLMADFDKDFFKLEKWDSAPYSNEKTPTTGPAMKSMKDEDILSAMDSFIEDKCGPGSIHPHLNPKDQK